MFACLLYIGGAQRVYRCGCKPAARTQSGHYILQVVYRHSYQQIRQQLRP